MLLQLLVILLTALLSSVLTLLLAYWLFQKRLRRRLELRLKELQEELGAAVQDRVRRGVVEGISSISSPEVLRGTRRALTATASDLMRSGLDTLLGGSSGDPED
jgi:hypothetical protein